MSEIALQPVYGHLRQSGPVDGDRLHLVVVRRGRAVRVDEGQRPGNHVPQDGPQGPVAPLTRARRARDVVGIVADRPTAGHPFAGVHLIAPTPRIDDRGGSLADIQPRTVAVEGAARLRGEGLEGLEARDDEFRLPLGTDHHGMVATPALQGPHGGDLRTEPRRTGVRDDHGVVRVAEEGGNAACRPAGKHLVAERILTLEQRHVALRGRE